MASYSGCQTSFHLLTPGSDFQSRLNYTGPNFLISTLSYSQFHIPKIKLFVKTTIFLSLFVLHGEEFCQNDPGENKLNTNPNLSLSHPYADALDLQFHTYTSILHNRSRFHNTIGVIYDAHSM